MGFSEMSHAFISASFYVHLTEMFGQRGENAFVHATRHYAEQRGKRMAQRAIRDGMPLNFRTYQQYSEWRPTKEAIDSGVTNQVEVKSYLPDRHLHITVCPWHSKYKEMGVVHGGHVYCEHLDSSLCRGFNPELSYNVGETLHKGTHCTHILKDVSYDDRNSPIERDDANARDFEYHCAHCYYAFSEIVHSIFGAKGKSVACTVLEDFAKQYGEIMADAIVCYENTNFNVI